MPVFPNVVEFIENIFVAELIPIFVPLFISSASIVKAPIVPSVALIFLTTKSPLDFIWNLEELISILLLEPLI